MLDIIYFIFVLNGVVVVIVGLGSLVILQNITKSSSRLLIATYNLLYLQYMGGSYSLKGSLSASFYAGLVWPVLLHGIYKQWQDWGWIEEFKFKDSEGYTIRVLYDKESNHIDFSHNHYDLKGTIKPSSYYTRRHCKVSVHRIVKAGRMFSKLKER